MQAELANKVVVVTGGTRGLGFAIARQCANAGARVVVTSRTPSAVEGAVAAIRDERGAAVGMPCDVTNAADVSAVRELALTSLAGWMCGSTTPVSPRLMARRWACPPNNFCA